MYCITLSASHIYIVLEGFGALEMHLLSWQHQYQEQDSHQWGWWGGGGWEGCRNQFLAGAVLSCLMLVVWSFSIQCMCGFFTDCSVQSGLSVLQFDSAS